jgi:hypothetical protein
MRLSELTCVGLAMVLTMVCGASAGAEDSRPSQNVLNEMGLGGLAVMSDEEAMKVRGHGFKQASSVSVFGNSFATFDTPVGTSHSENGYASDGKHFAFGKNYSEAGIQFEITGGLNGGSSDLSRNVSRWGSKLRDRLGGGNNGGVTIGVTVKVFGGGFSAGGAL